jgi:IclR family KDG regulon transcriptional repressor
MLGTKFYEFASNVSAVPLLACAKPIMKELKNKCNENVHLAVLEGLEVVYIAIEQTSHPIRYHMEVGTTQSAHVTGVGKMLLSSCSNSQIRELYQSFEFKKRTPTTICSTDDLISELEQIRKRGYSIDNGEGYEGSKCFAGPIYGVGGKMVASLSISIPIVRIDVESDLEMIAAVKQLSGKLSQLLMEY